MPGTHWTPNRECCGYIQDTLSHFRLVSVLMGHTELGHQVLWVGGKWLVLPLALACVVLWAYRVGCTRMAAPDPLYSFLL
jgi:hypothetical protein